MKLTAIILTYKQHEALELCLRSAILHQTEPQQILVVENGYHEPNQEIFKKYKEYIDVLSLEENVGMMRALNLGTYNAKNKWILHVQDDNVFPENWDKKLIEAIKTETIDEIYKNIVISPNQIEPYPSMFKQFVHKDLGKTPNEFNLKEFINYERDIPFKRPDECGSTFPFLIHKENYLKIGGFDESYPGPWVVDWEFFMKCQMNKMKMVRIYNCHFYHFGSLATKSPEKQQIEDECHYFAFYKWGTYIKHDPQTNLKFL